MTAGTLYEVSKVYEAAWEFVFEESGPDGEITRDLQAIIDAVESDLTEKLDACCKVISELESDAKACSDEARRLSTRARSRQENSDKLRAYVKQTLERLGIRKHKGNLFDVSINNNPPSVLVTDERLLPDEFLEEVTTIKVKKAEIGKALKSGDFVPGAEFKSSTRLVIS